MIGWWKRFTAAILAMILLWIGYGNGFMTQAVSFEEVERQTILHPGASPMAAEPDVVTLTRGSRNETLPSSVLSLNGTWEMAAWNDVQNNLFGAWPSAISTQIPNSVPRSLFQAGKLSDPYVGLNAYEAEKAVQHGWCLRRSFAYTGQKRVVELAFDGIADRCDIYLNGEQIASHQGMFGGPVVDVTDAIRLGENTLVVVLKPAVDYTQTVVFNCTYGWHYAFIPPLGIWSTVTLRDVAEVEVVSPFLATVSHETGTMDLSVELTVREGASLLGNLTGTVRPKNFDGEAYSFSIPVSAPRGESKTVRLQFDVPEFRLWWPNGLGEQNLYTLELAYSTERGILCTAVTSFGIRSLEMVPFPSGESRSMYNRTAMINGETIFLKGAGWCTVDTLMEFTREKYDAILSRAREQGLNYLRAWGGGLPETEIFYELCDEYGICVYQEWPCCWDSQRSQPPEILYETVRENTKRIRNHPSLILYGGGNEGGGSTDDAVLNEIGKLTYEYDGTRIFWRQDGGAGGNGMIHDHIHWSGGSPELYITNYWNLQDANLHEYGMDSMMNLESIAKYATADEMAQWPIDPNGTIAQHTATFNGVRGWNPTPYGYDIDTLIHYASDFLKVDSLADLVLGSQLAQSMSLYLAIQNARIQFPNQSAILYYKLNDVYPGASWSTVDFYGSPKIAHYFVQDACRPLMAAGLFDRYNTYDKTEGGLTLPIYLLDDRQVLSGRDWQVTVTAYDGQFRIVRKTDYQGTGSAGKNVHLGDFQLSQTECDHSPLFIVIDLLQEGQEPIRSVTFLNYDRSQGCLFALPRTTLEYQLTNNTCTVRNTGAVPAVGVNLLVPSVSDRFVCSDNYFWLEPGEVKTIQISEATGIDGVSCFNLADLSDTEAPTAPTNIQAAASYDTVTLTWQPGTDDKGIMGYFLYRDGELCGYVAGEKGEYLCTGLSENTDYSFQLAAVDYNQNISKRSSIVKTRTTLDRSVPYAVSAKWEEENRLVVRYNKTMDRTSAENPLCYTLNDNGKVESVKLEEDGRTAVLSVSGMKWGEENRYAVTVVGAKDTTQTGNLAVRKKFVLDSGLAGYWSFDEAEEGLFYDQSGHMEPAGRMKGWSREESPFGYGVSLQEAGGRVMAGMTDFLLQADTAISLWLKPAEQTGFGILLGKGPKTAGHFELYTSGGMLMLYLPSSGDYPLQLNLSEYQDSWHHLALVLDKRSVTVYWDGRNISRIMIKISMPAQENLLSIGSLVDSQHPFAGCLDEIRLYNRALTEEEILRLAGKDPSLQDMRFSENYRNLNLHESFTLQPAFYPNQDIPAELTWHSSNEAVATVSEFGVVTGISEGSAVITARTLDGSQVEPCFVTVGSFSRGGLHPVLLTILCCVAAFGVFLIMLLLIEKRRKKFL